MQLVVPSAVSAAVNAAIAMRITISQKFFFIILIDFELDFVGFLPRKGHSFSYIFKFLHFYIVKGCAHAGR